MSQGNERGLSRRALLAASTIGVGALAGCPGGGGTPTAEPTESATAAPAEPEASEPGEDVLVDQVGYRQGDRKEGIVRTDADTFEVRDTADDTVVASGDLGEEIESANADETVRRADFSGVNEAGEYVLSVDDGAAESHPFEVGLSPWGQVLAQIGRHYTLIRSGVEIDDPVTELELEPGHPQDGEASVYWNDRFVAETATVDVSGGWYDAGDYGKYVPPACVAAAQLLLAYEWNPTTFTTEQFSMPPGMSEDDRNRGLPDVLAEVKYELEWLEGMQRPNGSVYHKVSGTEWPAMDTAPAEDTQDRYVFGMSTFGTAQFAGTMAIAARVFEEFDQEFAGRLLDNAEAAYQYLDRNPDPEFRQDAGQDDGSGPYRKDTDMEERFWAGAELLKTTGNAEYHNFLSETVNDGYIADPHYVSWDNTLTLGQWAYYTADEANDNRRDSVADAITSYADDVVATVEDNPYRIALTEDEFYWGSTKVAIAKGNVCLMANEIENTDAYVTAAHDQIHYALGRTPTTGTYVTGAGENPPENPHFRIAAATGYNIPGNVVGGPNANGGDPELDALIENEDPAPAKCYLDQQGSYASNEPAIDYAAALFFAMAPFVQRQSVTAN